MMIKVLDRVMLETGFDNHERAFDWFLIILSRILCLVGFSVFSFGYLKV
jgi:hypothetical protein